MQPRITMLTLGVDDLERAVKFYRDGLGLPTEGIVGTEFENGAVAFFDLEGLKLALFSRRDLAIDAGVAVTPPSVSEFSFGHNVRTREEVDQVMRQAAAAGAQVVKPACTTFWADMPVISRTPTGIFGRSPGIRPSCPRTERDRARSWRPGESPERLDELAVVRQRRLYGSPHQSGVCAQPASSSSDGLSSGPGGGLAESTDSRMLVPGR
jgi:uncharacterized protein